jgi:hypothetical protein
MRKNNPAREPKKFIDLDIRFRFSYDSEEGQILHYIKKYPASNIKNSYVFMMRAFWLPFAALWSGARKHDVHFMALNSIYTLMSHIDYICKEFSIPRPYTNMTIENYLGATAQNNSVGAVENKKEDKFDLEYEDEDNRYSDLSLINDNYDNI